MRITPGMEIAGLPARQVRDILRQAGMSTFTAGWLAATFDLAEADGVVTVRELLAGSYLEPVTWPDSAWYDSDHDDSVNAILGLEADSKFRLSTPGLALLNASAGKPFTRATATKALAEFLERLPQVHNDDDLAYDVGTVVLFGSYLDPTAAQVGDIDLAVELIERPLPDGTSREDRDEARRAAAYTAGRNFRSFLDEAFWPRNEVLWILKGRSRVLALHDLAQHRNFLAKIPHQVIHPAPKGLKGRPLPPSPFAPD